MIFEQVPVTKGARNWICVPDYKDNDSYGMAILVNLTGSILPQKEISLPVNITDSGIDMLAYCDQASSLQFASIIVLSASLMSVL